MNHLFQMPHALLVDTYPLSICLSFLISVVVRPLWQTFVSSLRVYEQSSIEGTEDPYEGRYDSDGAEQSLESFVIQVKVDDFFHKNSD